ncbi:MAG TPA: hypothetical protein VNH83_21980 [Bryobacteraceae bacterium]|nr:hypothetical protein [Bryobacteraceae bacterium]
MTVRPCHIPVCWSALFAFLFVSGVCVQAQPRADDAVAPFAGNSDRQTKHQVDTRVFGIVPSHNTLPDLSMVAPLGTRQKFGLATADSFDLTAYALAGLYAVFGQLDRQYPEFGLGASGFAKRYATAYGDQVIGNYMVEAIFPAMLHQDPRYYRMAHGGFIKRTAYAVSRILITRSDSSAEQFNYSQVGGIATAAGIETLYYPSRTLSNTMQRFGIQLASGGVFNVLREYWPDIRQKLSSRSRVAASKDLDTR